MPLVLHRRLPARAGRAVPGLPLVGVERSVGATRGLSGHDGGRCGPGARTRDETGRWAVWRDKHGRGRAQRRAAGELS